ncbi:PPC domain-containing DNA-binding protein [Ignavigranum ruoffiae]|uniref:PPC domain-containing DNA-binding protein n=1 Tax=Ignavigranum ruoffiae TaxID=89093 RepID=UPI0024AC9F72|nr:PPC domain-containing DNA-binding protein [Ignavigranum ruoffiae]
MEYKRFDQTIVLRVQRGEELLTSIHKVAEAENISLASVTGIGACDEVKLGFYQLSTHEYNESVYQEDLELTSLVGNITEKDQAYYGHFHATFGREDNSVIGGHLVSARVSVTGEIIIHCLPGQVNRQADQETGINLLSFE